MARVHAALGLLVLVVLPQVARGDLVNPDHRTRQCPPGSSGGYPHGTGPCRAQPCTDDRTCYGETCASTALCMDGNEVVSECGPGDSCGRGLCSRALRCVSPAPAGAPQQRPSWLGSPRGCDCAVAGGDQGVELCLLVAVSLLAASRRRWRRRASRGS